MLKITMGQVAHLEAAITALDAEVDRVMAPFSAARDHLDTITSSQWRAWGRPVGVEVDQCATVVVEDSGRSSRGDARKCWT
jgi:hypothetical protein